MQRCRQIGNALLLIGLLVTSIARPQTNGALPTPESVLGFRIGTEKKLADYHQMVEYLRKLDAMSERLQIENLGKTTEGNDFVMVIISSPANVRQLAEWRKIQTRLADPRGLGEREVSMLINRGRAVVLINCSIHATEVGATQMSLELAYHLASSKSTSVQQILDNVVILLVPAHNPDGQLMVVDWYRKNLNTKYETAPLPWLYHKYAGHDNNRDWFMFTQKETRLTVEKIHNIYHPHITVDMHQMGQNGARLFVPPYIDPIEPNVDPIIVSLLNTLGTYVQSTLTAQGKAGVVSNAIFDAWTPARAYPHYHGGLRFLTEAASVDYATAVDIPAEKLQGDDFYDARRPSWNFPKPWPGGKWTLRDIVDYDFAAAMAILEHAARNREFWLKSILQVQQNAVNWNDQPAAYVIPANQRDPEGLHALLEIMHRGMVEVYRAAEDFTADGVPFRQGDWIVPIRQPYGRFAKALLESQHYPALRSSEGTLRQPYDVTAHTLPLFLGVEVFAINTIPQLPNAPTKPGELTGELISGSSSIFALDPANTASYRALNLLLKKEVSAFWAQAAFRDGNQEFPNGTILIDGRGHESSLQEIARNSGADIKGLSAKPTGTMYRLQAPRVGLYKSWVANMDEGWTRWVLEQYGFAYTTLTDAEIRTGDLHQKFDVIILPDQTAKNIERGHAPDKMPLQYANGLGEIGIHQLRTFVDSGGTLLTLDSATELPIQHFWIQAHDVTADLPKQKFRVPGSMVRVLAEIQHPLAYGARREEAIFCSNSPAFRIDEGRGILTFPDGDLLLSGWLEGGESLAGQHALVEVPVGAGRVLLFGFRPQFRGQVRSSCKFLFNALYYSVAQTANDPFVEQ
ncbi:MAG: M14 family metallopeptidase [candidate division KSB1 bacterium]|nr:M14 family metallopeptidase [candidate division KSB1 bacterium]MDZ7300628.1 M14 family metallopeptidase [candidate division KSB1 bacterium]MDZ7309765.1 M14 family metallopeptidase [candidate division KSB1 bacterium]